MKITKKSRLKCKLKLFYKSRGMNSEQIQIRLISFFDKHGY